MPSIVVMSRPSILLICSVQERIALPFSSTVHDPQSPMPHPYLVPVRPRMSRRYHMSGISGSPSKVWDCPLTLKRTMTDSRVETLGNIEAILPLGNLVIG